MNDKRAKRKLSAILSADVKGYSRLMVWDEFSTIDISIKHGELVGQPEPRYRCLFCGQKYYI